NGRLGDCKKRQQRLIWWRPNLRECCLDRSGISFASFHGVIARTIPSLFRVLVFLSSGAILVAQNFLTLADRPDRLAIGCGFALASDGHGREETGKRTQLSCRQAHIGMGLRDQRGGGHYGLTADSDGRAGSVLNSNGGIG